jgi:hypothetical protein
MTNYFSEPWRYQTKSRDGYRQPKEFRDLHCPQCGEEFSHRLVCDLEKVKNKDIVETVTVHKTCSHLLLTALNAEARVLWEADRQAKAEALHEKRVQRASRRGTWKDFVDSQKSQCPDDDPDELIIWRLAYVADRKIKEAEEHLKQFREKLADPKNFSYQMSWSRTAFSAAAQYDVWARYVQVMIIGGHTAKEICDAAKRDMMSKATSAASTSSSVTSNLMDSYMLQELAELVKMIEDRWF